MKKKKPLAIQLYSLRKEAKKDFLTVLETIADIGYKGVEFAGYHDHSVSELSQTLKDKGLESVGSHVAIPTEYNITEIAKEAEMLGHKTLLVGFGPDDMKTQESLDNCIKQLQAAVKLTKNYGLNLAMHNHWWEFEQRFNGLTAYEIILQEVPDLQSELDIYWAAKAGLNPCDILNKWSSRIPLIHVKDGDFNNRMVHLPVGQGLMETSKILNSFDSSVVNWLVVEIDNCDTDMVKAVKDSYLWLTQNNFC